MTVEPSASYTLALLARLTTLSAVNLTGVAAIYSNNFLRSAGSIYAMIFYTYGGCYTAIVAAAPPSLSLCTLTTKSDNASISLALNLTPIYAYYNILANICGESLMSDALSTVTLNG